MSDKKKAYEFVMSCPLVFTDWVVKRWDTIELTDEEFKEYQETGLINWEDICTDYMHENMEAWCYLEEYEWDEE